MNDNSKFVFLTILGILIIIISIAFYFKNSVLIKISANLDKISPPIPSLRFKNPKNKNNVRCTMDVRRCPNGSYVGRVAPSCSFAPCPKNKF